MTPSSRDVDRLPGGFWRGFAVRALTGRLFMKTVTIGGRECHFDEWPLPQFDGLTPRVCSCSAIRGGGERYRYVMLFAGRKYVGMAHRMILGVSDRRVVVDHINHNGLDNRSANLRACSNAENIRNRRRNCNKPDGLPKGVTREKDNFIAAIKIAGRRIRIGRFKTVEAAAAAYAELSAKYHGEFGCLG